MNTTCDTMFAHAVRRAATGIRKQVNSDPEKCGVALAVILRSDRELDKHGLELFARGVTGQLKKRYCGIQRSGESAFAEAVCDAFDGWRKDDDADPDVEGKPLAGMLRGGEPALGKGEREMLA